LINQMAKLWVNGRPFDIELVVFDKDGTLIDFEHLWGERARQGVAALVRRVEGDAALARSLFYSLGYDPKTRFTAGNGPLATAVMSKLCTIMAAVLYQHGFSWDAAEEYVRDSFALKMGALPTADQIRPLGDVAGLFQRLTQAGVSIAVVTSDDREATNATLSLMGAAGNVTLLICGDDIIPNKPAPDALWRIANQLNIAPARIMMVGDTASDLLFGANAGVGCLVGVLGGVGDNAALIALADAVVDSIEQIEVNC